MNIVIALFVVGMLLWFAVPATVLFFVVLGRLARYRHETYLREQARLGAYLRNELFRAQIKQARATPVQKRISTSASVQERNN